ncbi:MAG: M64 family metallo-endopeptidase [Flavobacteriales bacterium]|nr:M64 family metallo-endopeptidase [Flavobacteriales bacterium]
MKQLLLSLLLSIPFWLAAQCDFTEITVLTETENYGPEQGWQIIDANGNLYYTFQADADFTSYEDIICLEDGCYIFESIDTYGDGWNGGTVSVNVDGVIYDYVLTDGTGDLSPFGVNETGCTLAGSCMLNQVYIQTSTQAYGAEVGWQIMDNEGNVYYSFAATADNSTYNDFVCIEDGCYVFIATDTYGDGWNGGSVIIDVSGALTNYQMDDGTQEAIAIGVNAEGCEVIIPGCTNPDALNYDEAATEDDGSCLTIQDYLDIQNITPLIASGPVHNRVNWGIQNRSSGNPNADFIDEDDFVSMLQDSLIPCFTIGDPLEKEPYARYRNFFNIDAWWWEDAPAEGEGWSWDILKGLRDEYYLPWQDDEHGWATLFSNTKFGGGGGAGVQPETRTGDGFMFGLGWETLLHEFGHTMPQVPDEYTSSGVWSGGECWEGANTTGWSIRDSIPWRNWIAEDTPLPTPYEEEYMETIGAFEGALTNYFGCHRPSARGCYMGAGGFGPEFGQDMCIPCRQRVVCLLYRYVDVIENPMPANQNVAVNGDETITFSADIVKPEPNTQTYTWLLNGNIIGEGSETIDVTFGSCDVYELTLVVEDTTDWVRFDAHFSDLYPKPMETHTWFIDQTAIESYDLSVETESVAVNCTAGPNGQLSLLPSGGEAPYTAYWEGQDVGLLHAELVAGEYTHWLVDGNGCGVSVTSEVTQDPFLGISVCAEYTEFWSVDLTVEGYDPNLCTILWSNDADGLNSGPISSGLQWVSVTTPGGCSRTLEFEVDNEPSPMSVSAQYFASEADTPTGSIYLNVTGGQPEFTVRWYDKEARDLTEGIQENAVASGFDFGHLPEEAFDDNQFSKWLQIGTSDVWIGIEFEQPEQIQYYTIMSGDDVEERDPTAWELQGSNDGSDWTVIDTRSGEDFPERRQVRGFGFDNPNEYSFYRLYVTANAGANEVQLQEIQLIGTTADDEFVYNPNADDMLTRLELAAGEYQYLVQDLNSLCADGTIDITGSDAFTPEGLIVVQESTCTVAVENPDASLEYVWLDSETGNTILGQGTSFAPPSNGNYWLAAINPNTGVMSSNRPGFAVTMPEMPSVSEVSEGVLGIVDPNSDLIYRWYDMSCGGNLLAEGEEYTPGSEAMNLYVGSWWAEEFPDPTDPLSIPGLMVRMDAADLNGDGQIDDPGPVSSSLYGWNFYPDNQWNEGSWFAFRGNYQNGLGIVDFATMWLQCIEQSVSDYQTVIMAYKENALSFEGSAPFFGMDDMMPYSAMPGLQLYSNNVPQQTLNGTTILNGDIVDPMSTPNPLEFCVLGQTFTQGPGFTDCTDTHWEGQVGEIIFYEDQLSEEELIGVSEYLRRKWISLADLESKRFEVIWDGTGIGIDEVLPESVNSEKFRVYPNPTDGRLALDVSNLSSRVMEVQLYDVGGRRLASRSAVGEKQIIRLDEEFSMLGSGSYLVIVLTENGKRHHQVVIKR